VDLLKLDCEGSEYAIIQGTAPEVWERIARVRMEYHEGRVDQLARHFEALGYQMTRTQTHTSNVGVLWFDRPVVRGKRSTVLMPGSGGTDSAGSGV
jgi:hypothetical protein